jgi:hypothetical protein
MNSKLDDAWKQAGTTMQVLAIFPTLLVVVMGIGGGKLRCRGVSGFNKDR